MATEPEQTEAKRDPVGPSGGAAVLAVFSLVTRPASFLLAVLFAGGAVVFGIRAVFLIGEKTPAGRKLFAVLASLLAVVALLAAVGPRLLGPDPVRANEAAAVTALRRYRAAQERYREQNLSRLADNGGDGTEASARLYAPGPSALGGPDAHRDATGDRLGYLPPDMATADRPESAADGYWYLPADIDRAEGFGLFAVPAEPGKTGVRTYYVGADKRLRATVLEAPPAPQTLVDESWQHLGVRTGSGG